jgi:hypothetical protein
MPRGPFESGPAASWVRCNDIESPEDAQQLLGGVRPNIAMMLDERASPEQARAYARRWMVEDDRQVDRRVRNLEELLWRPYESCYTDGLALCRRFTNSDPSRFRRLLHEQLTPSDLLSDHATFSG